MTTLTVYDENNVLVGVIHSQNGTLYLDATGNAGGDVGLSVDSYSDSQHYSMVGMSAKRVDGSAAPCTLVLTLLEDNKKVSELYTDEHHVRSGGSDMIVNPVEIKYVTTASYRTSTTSLSDIDDLRFDVVSGGKYRFIARLRTSAPSNGGLKFALDGDCTVTSIWYNCTFYGTNDIIRSNTLSTALGSAQGSNSGHSYVEIVGYINVSTEGSICLQFAQNTSNATNSIVHAGGTFELAKLN